MLHRRWAIIAGLGVVEVWIFGLIVRSLAGDGHSASAGLPASPIGLASPAAVGGPSPRTIDVGLAPTVIVDDSGDAALRVTVRSGARVSVIERTQRSGWICADERPVDIERTPDGVRISRRSGNVTMMFGSFSRRLEIVVPPQARLDVRNAGSIVATGLRAAARFHTDDGTIAVSDHRGDLSIMTDNGRIELSEIEAPSIEATSDSGRISFAAVRADRVALKTDDGRIEIGHSLLRGGHIETDHGRVALGLDPQSDVTVSAQADSRRVSAESPLSVTATGDDEDAPKTVRIGNGSGRLDIAGGEGSIVIAAGEFKIL